MKNYGKIVIMADTIEQAQAELDTIKSLVSMGVTSASGEVKIEEMEMPRVNGIMAERMANAYAEKCCCPCPCCCCEDDDEDEDEWEDEDIDEIVELNGQLVSRFIAEVMGL